MSHKLIIHPPDLKLHFTGRTPKELFTNGLFALSQFMDHEEKNPNLPPRSVLISAQNQEELLMKFMNEIIRLSRANHEVYRRVNFQTLNHGNLEAQLFGYTALFPHCDIKELHFGDICLKEKNRFEVNFGLEV